jgi:hypothetical protein
MTPYYTDSDTRTDSGHTHPLLLLHLKNSLSFTGHDFNIILQNGCDPADAPLNGATRPAILML